MRYPRAAETAPDEAAATLGAGVTAGLDLGLCPFPFPLTVEEGGGGVSAGVGASFGLPPKSGTVETGRNLPCASRLTSAAGGSVPAFKRWSTCAVEARKLHHCPSRSR